MGKTVSRRKGVAFFTEFAEQVPADNSNELVIPEDLSALSDEQLSTLHAQAVEEFNAIYQSGNALTSDDLNVLADLTDGIELLSSEIGGREEAANARLEQAEQLAARINLSADTDTDEDEDATDAATDAAKDEAEDGAEDAEDATSDEGAAETVTASTRPRRINISRSNFSRLPERRDTGTLTQLRDVMRAAGEGSGYAAGTAIDYTDAAAIIDRRLGSYSHAQFARAAREGKPLRQQMSVATFIKPSDPELTITSNEPDHITEIMNRAVNEKRLAGGSLVAAGGWCAPSETLYDLVELESNDGLLSIPEVTVARGGFQRTLGPTFFDIYSGATGWDYSEEQDIAGDYDGAGGGSKPCFQIDCPDWDEFRLRAAGICVGGGLLQSRGYPELVARVIRGVLTAHRHRMSGRKIARIEAESTAIAYTDVDPGAAAPLLTALEQQLEYLRYRHRLARSATVEVVLPFWLKGALRTDLALVAGLSPADRFNVTDAQIDAWFRSRGANPQYVYNWQDITGDPGSFKSWPTAVKVLMYPAGTWVGGAGDVLSLDTIYDSALLSTNDYTALWAEEGWLVAKMLHDSFAITIPLCYSGEVTAPVANGAGG